jgi:hypothetical protein
VDVDEQSLALWHNLVSAVERALADHPRNAAELNVDTEHLNIHVRPRRGEAADIDISFDGVDEVCLEVGLTEAHMWQVGPEPLDETIYRIVAAVAAGHIEEVGSFNATARSASGT